ncbi:MAG: PaaX family transcriptional regulator C-terminal domain-containing protein [Chloroflexota bacterium]
MTQQPNTKFVVMVLLGEYIRPRGGKIWLSDLLNLLETLNIGERTARSTITRMAREDWFTIERQGRQSKYAITPFGQKILQGGDWRLEDSLLTDWDGRWHLITYSLPEDIRKLRDHLRKQLSWLGYGRLSTGLWLSPHNRQDEINQIIYTHKIEQYIHFFQGTYAGPLTNHQLITQCWNLPDLATQYEQFLNKYEGIPTPKTLSPKDSFQARFWLTADLFPILRQDPNLPQALLPTDWIGIQGKRLFYKLRAQLALKTDCFINEMINGGTAGK